MVYIIMGVMGSGKTTIGQLLAEHMHCTFRDADDYHSPSNRGKMAHGIPLTDEDRKPWIFAVRAVIDTELAVGVDCVMACSALREKYRTTLIQGRENIKLIYLKGDKELIAGRVKDRGGHFVHPAILDSQFADLEEPKNAITVDISKTPEEIVHDIISAIKPHGRKI
jgi:gluconokinase